MSSATDAIETKSEKSPLNWSLWFRQIGAILRLELEKKLPQSTFAPDLSGGVFTAVSSCGAGVRYAARKRVARFQPDGLFLLDHLQRHDSADARVFWFRMDLHEPVSR